jgi:hypothetical protein
MDEVEDRIQFHRHDRIPDDKEQPNPKKLAAGEPDALVASCAALSGRDGPPVGVG